MGLFSLGSSFVSMALCYKNYSGNKLSWLEWLAVFGGFITVPLAMGAVIDFMG